MTKSTEELCTISWGLSSRSRPCLNPAQGEPFEGTPWCRLWIWPEVVGLCCHLPLLLCSLVLTQGIIALCVYPFQSFHSIEVKSEIQRSQATLQKPPRVMAFGDPHWWPFDSLANTLFLHEVSAFYFQDQLQRAMPSVQTDIWCFRYIMYVLTGMTREETPR